MTATTAKRSSWIPELAGYRAIAALAVFGFHLASIEPPGGLVGRLTVPLGNAAVSVFFVLSGFLVYRPFADWAILDHAPVAAWRFVIRRLARIMPLYWVVLTVHFLVTEPDNPLGLGDYLTSYLLVQNFRGSLVFVPPFVAWSLCIELWFSIALPFIAAPLRRAGRGRTLVERTQIQLLGFGLLAGGAIVFRIWALTTPGDGRVLWMPAYLDWFAAGLVLAVLRSYWSERPPESSARQLAANPWFLSSLGILSYWTVTQLGLPGGFVAPTRFQAHMQFLLQGLMSFLLVAAVVLPGANLGRARSFFASRTLQWLGSISYGIYLIHPVITDELVKHFPGAALGLIAPYALAGTLAMAAILHRLVETPASRIVDRLVVPDRSNSEPVGTKALPSAQPLRDLPVQGADSPADVAGSAWVQSLVVASFAFASPLLSLPNRYVGDSRFELTFAPTARLDRMFVGWDSTRGLGRPAEEFWPLLTFLSSALDGLGVSPWVLQRVVHGSLLALAAIGMVLLARALDPGRSHAPLLAALIYAFGPASSLYLLPVPLYTSYAAAPWLALAVLGASRRHPLCWAGLVAVVVFLVGNADPPGLILACLPAASIGVALLVSQKEARRRLLGFAAAASVLTILASAAMLTKTMIGSAALAHRLAETESVEAVATASSFAESLRGAGFWLLYFRLTPTTFRDHLSMFIANGWVVVATIVPLAIGIAGMSRRVSRTHLLALAWVLVGVVVMVGPFPTTSPTPWGRTLLELFAASDVAFAFRSSHKAGVILSMGTSLLAAWAVHDLADAIRQFGRRTAVVASVATGFTILATITAPFWTTPLYDDLLTASAVPDYWTEAAAQLEVEASGRVMVIPGSTNNGYRWGTIGDDLIDVLVPSPVVSTTLPLSTPLPADIIDALDHALTSGDYQPGTLAPIAHRLGITHLVIRNDLAWELQGVARPSQLDAVRSDADLTLVGRHGAPGRFVVNPLDPDEAELALPPVEIYRIGSAEPPGLVVLPDEGAPRTIVVDGTGPAFVRLAEERLLDGGHIVRFAPTIELSDGQLDDLALVVVTGTTRAIERRIEYYGYRFAPALDAAEANNWLGVDGPAEITTIELDSATATSTVDRWLLGLDHQPIRAFDGDTATSWLIPRLAQGSAQQLSLEFDEPTDLDGVTIRLVDDGQRIGDLSISIDGTPVVTERVDDILTLGQTSVEELTISIGRVDPGVAAIGVAEVEFSIEGSNPTLVATHFPTGIPAGVPADVPALFLLGPDQPSQRPINADIATWRTEPHHLTVTMNTDATTTRCLPIVEIDGEAVSMLIRPNGDGTATAEPCRGNDVLILEPGPHRITVVSPAGDAVSDVRLSSGSLDLAPVTRTTIDPGTGANTEVTVGDIVLLPHSYDTDWSLEAADARDIAPSDSPFAADGLSGFFIEQHAAGSPSNEPLSLIGPGGVSAAAIHTSDVLVYRAWWVSAAGLALALVAVAFGGRPQPGKQFATEGPPPRRWVRLGATALPGAAVMSAWLFAGPVAVIGAALAWSIERLRPRWPFLISAVGLVTITSYRAWPLLTSGVEFIDPGRGDSAMRIVVGMLFMAGASALRRISAESPR